MEWPPDREVWVRELAGSMCRVLGHKYLSLLPKQLEYSLMFFRAIVGSSDLSFPSCLKSRSRDVIIEEKFSNQD